MDDVTGAGSVTDGGCERTETSGFSPGTATVLLVVSEGAVGSGDDDDDGADDDAPTEGSDASTSANAV